MSGFRSVPDIKSHPIESSLFLQIKANCSLLEGMEGVKNLKCSFTTNVLLSSTVRKEELYRCKKRNCSEEAILSCPDDSGVSLSSKETPFLSFQTHK